MNYNHRCPKGNRQRRVLNQVANAVKAKTIFAIAYRRLVPCLGHAQAIGAIVQLCRLIWKISRTFVLGFRLDPQAPRAIAKIAAAIGERCGGETSLSDHRSASRMLSDMLCEGARQSPVMTTGGVNAMATRTVHPTKDVAPRT